MKDNEKPTIGPLQIEGGFEMEQEIDYGLLGERVERFIEACVPNWLIRLIVGSKETCNCNLRKELLNNWHLDYRDYKASVKQNKIDNYQIAREKLDGLKKK